MSYDLHISLWYTCHACIYYPVNFSCALCAVHVWLMAIINNDKYVCKYCNRSWNLWWKSPSLRCSNRIVKFYICWKCISCSNYYANVCSCLKRWNISLVQQKAFTHWVVQTLHCAIQHFRCINTKCTHNVTWQKILIRTCLKIVPMSWKILLTLWKLIYPIQCLCTGYIVHVRLPENLWHISFTPVVWNFGFCTVANVIDRCMCNHCVWSLRTATGTFGSGNSSPNIDIVYWCLFMTVLSVYLFDL